MNKIKLHKPKPWYTIKITKKSSNKVRFGELQGIRDEDGFDNDMLPTNLCNNSLFMDIFDKAKPIMVHQSSNCLQTHVEMWTFHIITQKKKKKNFSV